MGIPLTPCPVNKNQNIDIIVCKNESTEIRFAEIHVYRQQIGMQVTTKLYIIKHKEKIEFKLNVLYKCHVERNGSPRQCGNTQHVTPVQAVIKRQRLQFAFRTCPIRFLAKATIILIKKITVTSYLRTWKLETDGCENLKQITDPD
jgi:hypothetical protein